MTDEFWSQVFQMQLSILTLLSNRVSWVNAAVDVTAVSLKLELSEGTYPNLSCSPPSFYRRQLLWVAPLLPLLWANQPGLPMSALGDTLGTFLRLLNYTADFLDRGGNSGFQMWKQNLDKAMSCICQWSCEAFRDLHHRLAAGLHEPYVMAKEK